MKGASDHRSKTLQAALEDVIRCSRFQAFNRNFLADISGDEHERELQPALQKKFQSCQPIEIRKAVVGEDQLEIRHRERLNVSLATVHTPPLAIVPALLKRSDIQLRVYRIVVEQQDS